MGHLITYGLFAFLDFINTCRRWLFHVLTSCRAGSAVISMMNHWDHVTGGGEGGGSMKLPAGFGL